MYQAVAWKMLRNLITYIDIKQSKTSVNQLLRNFLLQESVVLRLFGIQAIVSISEAKNAESI